MRLCIGWTPRYSARGGCDKAACGSVPPDFSTTITAAWTSPVRADRLGVASEPAGSRVHTHTGRTSPQDPSKTYRVTQGTGRAHRRRILASPRVHRSRAFPRSRLCGGEAALGRERVARARPGARGRRLVFLDTGGHGRGRRVRCRRGCRASSVPSLVRTKRRSRDQRDFMRRAPSSRMTSPFNIGFSTMCLTSSPNSAGSPRRFG